MSSLSHHGIKGQRWGVRRYQNKDGTRTAAGKARDYKKARELKQKTYDHYDKYGPAFYKKPVAAKMYLKAERLEDPSITPNESSAKANAISAQTVIDAANLAEAIRSDPTLSDDDKAFYKDTVEQYLDKAAIYSYISDDIRFNFEEKGKPITDREKDWNDYVSRQKEYLKKRVKDGDTWLYRYEQLISFPAAQHTSIGGTMYIEGNALILGDSSYLEHHGIRGQRWGVRRFQNRDGSLTNAGRKRLGYATKGAAQTVGKAFKAGVKAGGNAVKAVKAHHEKKEAEKLQKKKEKASKTRLGVMANKDLFTNEEIRKLNERFKLEDEMKMATLQKGVEIAKAVGTIALNVGTMAKAYEDVTGQSLSPIKRKAAEEKAKQDAEDRKRKLAKEDAETKRAEDKEKRDIEDRERRIKLEDEDRVRKQAKEDADAQRAENAEKRAQAKEQRDSSMAVELQRKAKAAADEQEHKAVKAKAESRSAILDVLDKIDKIQDHDDDDNNPPGGGIDNWNDDDYLNFFKKTGIIHSGIIDSSSIQNGVLFVDSSDSLAHHDVRGQQRSVKEDSMTHYVENGTLFINAGDPYLEHHGVKGMKWGKHLMAGKGVDAGAGGGSGEDDEKLKEMAKKAGMSVAEYRNKFAKEISRMNTDSAERKEGSHWALAKADVYGKTENHMPLLENKHKDKNAKEAMINNARLAETKYKAQQAAQEYTRKHTNSQKDIDKWRNAAYLDSSNYLHKELAEARTEKAQQYYKNSVGGKIDRAKQKAGSALREAKSALKEGPSGVGDRIYDAAGGKYKKQAVSNAKAAREDVQKEQLANRMANQQRAREASEVRKKGGRASRDKGFNTVNGHDVIAEGYRNARQKHQKAASEANAKYEKSLAGRAEAAGKRVRKAGNELSAKATAAKKLFSGTSPKAKKAVIAKKKASPTSYEKRINDAKNSVEKAARSNEAAYKHAKEVYRQTGSDSDAYKQAIKRSRTTLRRSLENQKRLTQKKRRPADIGKKRAKHFDNTNAIYTEGTRLVINSKWG